MQGLLVRCVGHLAVSSLQFLPFAKTLEIVRVPPTQNFSGPPSCKPSGGCIATVYHSLPPARAISPRVSLRVSLRVAVTAVLSE